MSSQGTHPGGPAISSAKKRRLAALEKALGASNPDLPAAKKPPQPPSTSQQQPPTTTNNQHQNPHQKNKRPRDPSSSSRQQQQQQQQQQRTTKSQSQQQRSTASTLSSGRATTAITKNNNAAQATSRQQQQTTSEPLDPLYIPLSDELRAGPVGHALGIRPPGAPGPANGTEGIITLFEELLATSSRPLDAHAVIKSRLKDKVILLENPVGNQKQQQRGRRGQKSSAELGLATKSKQKKLGLYDLKSANLTYQAVLPLHARWQAYFKSLTQDAANLKELHNRIYDADYHGCLIHVASSKQTRLQGIKGIVVKATENTLQIVTEEDQYKVIPKAGCVFEFPLDGRKVVTVIGDSMPGLNGGNGGGGDRTKQKR